MTRNLLFADDYILQTGRLVVGRRRRMVNWRRPIGRVSCVFHTESLSPHPPNSGCERERSTNKDSLTGVANNERVQQETKDFDVCQETKKPREAHQWRQPYINDECRASVTLRTSLAANWQGMSESYNGANKQYCIGSDRSGYRCYEVVHVG